MHVTSCVQMKTPVMALMQVLTVVIQMHYQNWTLFPDRTVQPAIAFLRTATLLIIQHCALQFLKLNASITDATELQNLYWKYVQAAPGQLPWANLDTNDDGSHLEEGRRRLPSADLDQMTDIWRDLEENTDNIVIEWVYDLHCCEGKPVIVNIIAGPSNLRPLPKTVVCSGTWDEVGKWIDAWDTDEGPVGIRCDISSRSARGSDEASADSSFRS